MKKQFAGAEGFMIPRSARTVLSDVGIDQPRPAGLEIDEGVAVVRFALAKGFDLGAVQDQTGFESLEQVVVVGGGAILSDDLLLLSLFGFACGLTGGFARFRGGLGHSLILCDCEIKC
jgi:hypothetical protein